MIDIGVVATKAVDDKSGAKQKSGSRKQIYANIQRLIVDVESAGK